MFGASPELRFRCLELCFCSRCPLARINRPSLFRASPSSSNHKRRSQEFHPAFWLAGKITNSALPRQAPKSCSLKPKLPRETWTTDQPPPTNHKFQIPGNEKRNPHRQPGFLGMHLVIGGGGWVAQVSRGSFGFRE